MNMITRIVLIFLALLCITEGFFLYQLNESMKQNDRLLREMSREMLQQQSDRQQLEREMHQKELAYYKDLLRDYHESLPVGIPVDYITINSGYGW